MLFQGEGDVVLELVGLSVWGWYGRPDHVAREVSIFDPGPGRSQVLPMFVQFFSLLDAGLSQDPLFILTLSNHTWKLGMHKWCNPLLWHFAALQNSFPPDHCLILALSLKDFSKRNPGNSTRVQKPLFLSVC